MTTFASATGSALGGAIAKLLDMVEEENALLQQQQIVTHGVYTDRKNQALRELLAAQRLEMTSAARQEARPVLQRLSQALQLNARLLKHHIAAVGEISDLIVVSLKDAESDGTYTRGSGMKRGR